ncbi:MAG: aldo/keto reductase [Paenibacillus sp.]|nr:aldo/keto reductase [Paenibacillus sp.]
MHINSGALPGLSKLTLGTVQLGMPYGIHNGGGMPSEADSFELLRQARDSGITSYDTAAAYGGSEALLGKFFSSEAAGEHSDKSEPPLITTKIHLKPERDAGGSDIERAIREQLEQSLTRLRLSTLPIVMLHNPQVMESFGAHVTAAFKTMRREGLIGCAGISVSRNAADEYETLWPYLRDDTYEAVQIPMNLWDHRPLQNGCVAMLGEAGKAVFVRSVFLQGLFYMKEEDLPPALQLAREPLVLLRRLCERYGVSIAQAAVSFIRDMPGVSSLVIGAEKTEQVLDNVRLVSGPPLQEEMREEILACFGDIPEFVITPPLWNSGK